MNFLKQHVSLISVFAFVLMTACGSGAQFAGQGGGSSNSGSRTKVTRPPERGSAEPSSGIVGSGDAVVGTPANPQDFSLTESEFTTQQKSGKVDMVWAIDNSSSMSEEAQHVRDNFSSFITNVESYTDLSLTLVSQKGNSDTKVEIPADKLNNGHSQINVAVGSNDAISLFTSGLCAASKTDPDASWPLLCGLYATERWLENNATISSIKGQLKPKFRTGAKKVFVVVTDDDIMFISPQDFMNVVKAEVKEEVSVFAFRGVASKNGCFVDNRGLGYEKLASDTKGKVFDICDLDWKPHFSSLTQSVYELVDEGFVLVGKDVHIQNVYLDGILLSTEDYFVSGGKLHLSKGVAKTAGQKLLVKFLKKKE